MDGWSNGGTSDLIKVEAHNLSGKEQDPQTVHD